jgi:hypothetical protein
MNTQKSLIVGCILIILSLTGVAQNKRPALNSTITERTTFHLLSDGNPGRDFQPKTPNQGSLIQIFDSVYVWQLDTLTNAWNPEDRTINMIYDAKNNLTSCIAQIRNGSAWVNSDKFIYTYDADHNQTSKSVQNWNGNAWINSFRFIWTYDVNNNQTGSISQNWNGSAWVNTEEWTLTYDAKNNRTSGLIQTWNGSAWENSIYSTYIYDANNNLTSETDLRWNDSVWANSWQYNYSYDINNSLSSYVVLSWDGNAWENAEKDTLTYDANNNLKSELYHNWNGTAWFIANEVIYTYDANNNLTNELVQVWNDSTWVNQRERVSSYDANNFQKSIVFKYWNSTGTEVTSGDSTYYYFHTVLGIDDLKMQDESIAVYPNPTTGKFTINSKNAINSLEIYDLSGQPVNPKFRFSSQKSSVIDLSGHSKGIYILEIQSGMKDYRCKIVLH